MILSFGLFILAGACKSPEERATEANAIVSEDTSMNVTDQNAMPADNATATVTDNNVVISDTAAKDKMPVKKSGKASVAMVPADSKEKMEMDKEGVYNRAEIMPSFPGGEKALARFVQDNIEYPETALDNDAEGTVQLSFSVDETGKIYTPTVSSEKLGYGLDEEALRVVKKMPKWNPGQIKGKNVKTKFTLPISYKVY